MTSKDVKLIMERDTGRVEALCGQGDFPLGWFGRAFWWLLRNNRGGEINDPQ